MDNLIKVNRSDGTPVLATELVASISCSIQSGVGTFFVIFFRFNYLINKYFI